MRFQLPTYDPPLTSPHCYCSTNEYEASGENFVPSVRLALRNCFQD
jgi:hypothetical protein